jgi:hypothetical protein
VTAPSPSSSSSGFSFFKKKLNFNLMAWWQEKVLVSLLSFQMEAWKLF